MVGDFEQTGKGREARPPGVLAVQRATTARQGEAPGCSGPTPPREGSGVFHRLLPQQIPAAPLHALTPSVQPWLSTKPTEPLSSLSEDLLGSQQHPISEQTAHLPSLSPGCRWPGFHINSNKGASAWGRDKVYCPRSISTQCRVLLWQWGPLSQPFLSSPLKPDCSISSTALNLSEWDRVTDWASRQV